MEDDGLDPGLLLSTGGLSIDNFFKYFPPSGTYMMDLGSKGSSGAVYVFGFKSVEALL